MWACTRRWWPRRPDPQGHRCGVCGEPATRQVTGTMVADIHLKLDGAEPRCKGHARILLRRL